MSASLVGSEMCIRDRRSSTLRLTWASNSCRSIWMSAVPSSALALLAIRTRSATCSGQLRLRSPLSARCA
eukprot:5799086-Alexandrium_andersonii.AAC.1